MYIFIYLYSKLLKLPRRSRKIKSLTRGSDPKEKTGSESEPPEKTDTDPKNYSVIIGIVDVAL